MLSYAAVVGVHTKKFIRENLAYVFPGKVPKLETLHFKQCARTLTLSRSDRVCNVSEATAAIPTTQVNTLQLSPQIRPSFCLH